MDTVLDQLLALRDRQREFSLKGAGLISGDELPWELNAQGKMKWYMHPFLQNQVFNSFMFYMQEIPPGSRSGRQRHQGNQVIHILSGQGYTLIDGVRHEWEAGDVVQLPLRPKGVVFQHFNGSTTEPVRLIACEPNLVFALNVDRGAGFEQLEACPEYLESR